MQAGALAAISSAVVAVIGQIGYFKVIHSEWPDYMVEQTRQFAAEQHLPIRETEAMVEEARRTFELSKYAIQSAITEFILGVVSSAIFMIFLRSRKPSDSKAFKPQTF